MQKFAMLSRGNVSSLGSDFQILRFVFQAVISCTLVPVAQLERLTQSSAASRRVESLLEHGEL